MDLSILSLAFASVRVVSKNARCYSTGSTILSELNEIELFTHIDMPN